GSSTQEIKAVWSTWSQAPREARHERARQLDPPRRPGPGPVQAVYAEGLGWKVKNDYGVSVFFEPNGGSLVGFYGRDGLATDKGARPGGRGLGGRGRRRFDAACAPLRGPEGRGGPTRPCRSPPGRAPRSSSPPPLWSGAAT